MPADCRPPGRGRPRALAPGWRQQKHPCERYGTMLHCTSAKPARRHH